jgi:TetR/AcrR family transcriptional regulator, regulator of cefoperazone and chloramphenicol sensitivity
MISPLEKARKDPDSMKARILKVARRVFGEYGFHGTTTRLIAQETGIDISTLHYHWGDKASLYEAVILDITDDLKRQLAEVEKIIHGLPLAKRMEIAIDAVTDYLFACPEVSNLILFRYFGKTRHEATLDFHMPEFVSDIAISMHLSKNSKNVSVEAKMKVLAIMNAIHNFISGEEFFRFMLKLDKEDYMSRVKETLRFILIPAFAPGERMPEPREAEVYEDRPGGWLWVNEKDR